MAVNYRDNTPFEGDNHTVGELAKAIRTKMYGVDVREPIAQAVEKMENWTKGNNIGQIIATPTKVFANLSALQSAYPNGADGVFVTTDNGHKYYWSGQWVDAGLYQSAGLADHSVTEKQLEMPVHYGNLTSNVARVVDSVPWKSGGGTLSTGDGWAIFNATDGDKGFVIPVKLKQVPDFDLKGTVTLISDQSATGNESDDKVEMFLVNDEHELKYGLGGFQRDGQGHSVDFEIPSEKIPDKSFGILVVGHSAQKITAANMYLSDNRSDTSLQNEIFKLKNFAPLKNSLATWNNQPVSFQHKKNYSLITTQSGGNTFLLKLDGLDLSKNVYVSFEILSSRNSGDFNVWTNINNGINISNNSQVIIRRKLTGAWEKVNITLEKELISLLGDTKTLSLIVQINGTEYTHKIRKLRYSNFDIPHTVNVGDFVKLDTEYFELGDDVNETLQSQTSGVEGLQLYSPATVAPIDGIIGKIKAYAPSAGTYNFKIGTLDQNQLIVSERNYSIYLRQGYNEIYPNNVGMIIEKGERLYMQVKDGLVYQSSGQYKSPNGSVLRDSKHSTTNVNYVGNIVYESDVRVPFSYAVIAQESNEIHENLSNRVDEVESVSSQFEIFRKNVFLTAPNGRKFILHVSNDGTLSASSSVPNKVVMFGNSIISHGWLGGVGMAANKDHDYYTLVKNYILSKNSNASVYRSGKMNWENLTTTADRDSYADTQLLPEIPSDTDLVTIQWGDNINTDEKKATLGVDAAHLIEKIRTKAPNANVLWIACWYNADNIPVIKSVCEEKGITFVDISGLRTNQNRGAVGDVIIKQDGTEYTIDDAGVASHPNDRGHAAIANTIISNFLF